MGDADISSIVVDGFRAWNRNHVLGVPYILGMFFVGSFILACLCVAALAIAAFGALFGGLVAVFMAVFAFVGGVVIYSFFAASAIEMAQRAAAGQSVRFGQALSPSIPGARDLAIINACVGAVAAVVIVPLILTQIILRVEVMAVFSIAVSCALMYAPYFAVLGKRGPVGSLSDSWAMFRGNSLLTILLYSLTTGVSQLIGFVILPLILMSCAILLPVGYLLGARFGADMILPVFVASCVGLFIAAVTLVSALVVAPLGNLWQLGAFMSLGGGVEN